MMGAGIACWRLVRDLYDEDTRPGEKPRTTLWELQSVEVLVSEPTTGGLILERSLSTAVATVDVEESGTMWDFVVEGGGLDCSAGCSVFSLSSLFCSGDGIGKGARGSKSFFSLMEMTKLSRSIGVMCFSVPRFRLSVESCLRMWGRDEEVDCRVEVLSTRSSESSDSTLEERAGMDSEPESEVLRE